MENPEDEDAGSTKELVIGKTSGSGLKISVLRFDLSVLKDLPKDIWIYDSNLILSIKDDSEGADPWKAQTTKIYPITKDWSEISTVVGQLTSEQNMLDDPTGSFDEETQQPMYDGLHVVADFTDTIHRWIKPSKATKDEPNRGIALVNEYSDGSNEGTDARNVKYYSFDNETLINTEKGFVPFIDICYKEVEIRQCGDNSTAKSLPVEMSVVLIDDGANHNNESLAVGTDVDGTTKRFLIKFNLDQISTGNFDTAEISDAFIHLNFLDLTDGDETERANRTINVYRVTENWKETSAKWSTVSVQGDDIGSEDFEEQRLGGTSFTIGINKDTVRDWLDGVEENYGLLIVDTNEDLASRIPMFSDNVLEDEEDFRPTLEVCIPKKEATPTPKPTTTAPQVTTVSQEQTTVTTKPVFNAPLCGVKYEDPSFPDIEHPDDNTTICVSTEPMQLKICADETGQCKKGQSRTMYGELVTTCECCQPVLEAETKTFECKPADGSSTFKEELVIQVIKSCQCGTCENTIFVDHTRVKRSLGFSASGLF